MKSLIESGAAMLNSEKFVDECINTIITRYGADLGGQEYESQKKLEMKRNEICSTVKFAHYSVTCDN